MAGPATLYQAGDHASRPANGAGCVLYSCTDHDLVYRDDGSSWTTFMTLVGGSGGDVATDTIWDAAGDLVQGSGANTAAKLSLGAASTVLRSTGSAAAWALPPGHEFDYAQATSNVTVSGTAEASETTLQAGNSAAYDGSTAVMIEFFCARVSIDPSATGRGVIIVLYEDSTFVGRMGVRLCKDGDLEDDPVFLRVRRTPSNASHTYTVKAYKTNASDVVTFYCGSGGSAAQLPMYLRVTKA